MCGELRHSVACQQAVQRAEAAEQSAAAAEERAADAERRAEDVSEGLRAQLDALESR